MISASPPTLDRSEGHGPLLTRPLHESMGQEVVHWLSKQAGMELPGSGCLAGQSVMSALMALYGKDPKNRGAVNDLDVFWVRADGLAEKGWMDLADEGTLWVRVPDESYDQIFARKLEVLSGVRVGKLNLVQLIPPARSTVRFTGPGSLSASERLDMVLSDFDLSCVEVGVDLSTGRMRWTREFADCMAGAPVIATELAVPERTWIRCLKKQEEMPWLRFDQAQILSTVQFAQAFAYLRAPPGKEMDERLEGWRRHHEEQLARLDPKQLVKPLWSREIWPSHDSVNRRAAHLNGMSWRMTMADLDVFRTMIATDLPSHSSNLAVDDEVDPTIQKLAALQSNSKEKFHGDVEPPDRAKILVDRGTPQQLLALFRADPRAMRSRLPADDPAPRHDLLDRAITNYKADFVPLLVAAGASFAAPGKCCQTIFAEALWMARQLPGDEAVSFADKLLSYAPDIGQHDGPSLFMDVVQLLNESDRLLKWWLDKRLPVNGADARGKRGADCLIRNKDHVSFDPLGRIVNGGQQVFSSAMAAALGEEAIEAARRKESFLQSIDAADLQGMRYSLAMGASPDEAGYKSVPPLVLASYQGDPGPLRLLLSQNANPNVSDSMHVTPLMVAAREGHAEYIDLLLAAGADINAVCREGKTALHIAVEKHQTDAAIQLLRAGADRLPIDRSELSPLDLACTWANTAVIGEYILMFEPGKERTALMNNIKRAIHDSSARSEDEKLEALSFLLAIEAREQLRNIRALGAGNQLKTAA